MKNWQFFALASIVLFSQNNFPWINIIAGYACLGSAIYFVFKDK